jgi:polyisoprenoid-binding protein YceI
MTAKEHEAPVINRSTGSVRALARGIVAGFQASVMLNRKDFGIDINMPAEARGVSWATR